MSTCLSLSSSSTSTRVHHSLSAEEIKNPANWFDEDGKLRADCVGAWQDAVSGVSRSEKFAINRKFRVRVTLPIKALGAH